MKKLFALLLALTMVFALAACGEKDPAPSGSGSTADPGTSQQGGDNKSDEVFDIADSKIRASAADLTTTLTGDEAAAMIAKIPAEIKKGIGELGEGLCSIAPSTSGSGYNFSAIFFVPKGSAVDYFTKLTDYYKTLEGTVTDETVIGDTHLFEMEFSWGEIYRCEAKIYEDSAKIAVGFKINE